jgi:hypothetical protein
MLRGTLEYWNIGIVSKEKLKFGIKYSNIPTFQG